MTFLLNPYRFGIGGDASNVMLFRERETSTSDTIDLSENIGDGDLAILFDLAKNDSGTPTKVIPSGWTEAISTTISIANARMTISWGILSSGDAESTITGQNADDFISKQLLVFSNSNPTTYTAGTFTGGGGTLFTNPPQQTIPIAAVSLPVVVVGNWAVSGGSISNFFDVPTMTQKFTATVDSGNVHHTVGYRIYHAEPVNHTVDIGAVGTARILQSGYIIVV